MNVDFCVVTLFLYFYVVICFVVIFVVCGHNNVDLVVVVVVATGWSNVDLFGGAGDPLDGTHEGVGHDAHAQEAVEQGEEVDGSPHLSWPRVLQ